MASWIRRTGIRAVGFAAGSLSEGAEEVLQGYFQEVGQRAADGEADISLLESIKEASPEAKEAFVLGTLGGAFFQATGAIKEGMTTKDHNAIIQEFIEAELAKGGQVEEKPGDTGAKGPADVEAEATPEEGPKGPTGAAEAAPEPTPVKPPEGQPEAPTKQPPKKAAKPAPVPAEAEIGPEIADLSDVRLYTAGANASLKDVNPERVQQINDLIAEYAKEHGITGKAVQFLQEEIWEQADNIAFLNQGNYETFGDVLAQVAKHRIPEVKPGAFTLETKSKDITKALKKAHEPADKIDAQLRPRIRALNEEGKDIIEGGTGRTKASRERLAEINNEVTDLWKQLEDANRASETEFFELLQPVDEAVEAAAADLGVPESDIGTFHDEVMNALHDEDDARFNPELTAQQVMEKIAEEYAIKEPAQKQPWEMTYDEYREWAIENHPKKSLRSLAKSKLSKSIGTGARISVEVAHDTAIIEALKAGKNVPAAAIESMPDYIQEENADLISALRPATPEPRSTSVAEESMPPTGEGPPGPVFEGLPPIKQHVALIKVDKSRFQPREASDPDLIKSIAADFKKAKWEPPILWRDPATNDLVVVAGHHRHEAALMAKASVATYQILPEGTTED